MNEVLVRLKKLYFSSPYRLNIIKDIPVRVYVRENQHFFSIFVFFKPPVFKAKPSRLEGLGMRIKMWSRLEC